MTFGDLTRAHQRDTLWMKGERTMRFEQLLAIFILLNPLSQANDGNLIINRVEKELLSNLSITVGKMSAITFSPDNCYSQNEVEKNGLNYFEKNETDRKYIIYYMKGSHWVVHPVVLMI